MKKYFKISISRLNKFIIFILLVGFNFGCTQQEKNELRSENEKLKNKVTALKQEIAKLKETADYHYQQGIDFISSKKYEEAKTEFETVIGKYPTSPLFTSAKQQLIKVKDVLAKIDAQRRAEERRRQEEEKYTVKNESEANSEWLSFRNDRNKYKDKIITWKCLYSYSTETNWDIFYWKTSHLYLNGNIDRPVIVDGSPEIYGKGYYKESRSAWEKAGPISKDDFVAITGKFIDVTDEGEVSLIPIRIKKIGYGGRLKTSAQRTTPTYQNNTPKNDNTYRDFMGREINLEPQ